jgi:radical SAM protein (TIGR01212 family)
MAATAIAMEPPYTGYSRYLKETYGEKTYRVSVDGGFSCPNRGGGSGCSFCSEDGARAPYLGSAGGVRDQVERAVGFLRKRYGADAFLLYFQASCGTNAPAAELARIYGSALSLAPFRGLIVGTRPDCVDEAKAELLGSYRRPDFDVWIELGLQTANEATLTRIHRGHTSGDFTRAFELCRRHGLKVAVHLIFGLPGETALDMARSVRFVSRLRPEGVKIHNLHIQASAPLAADFPKGELTAPGPRSHIEYVITALELLPPRTVIMRLTTDTPGEKLVSPRGFWDKQTFSSLLVSEMRRRGTRQGRLFENPVGSPAS